MSFEKESKWQITMKKMFNWISILTSYKRQTAFLNSSVTMSGVMWSSKEQENGIKHSLFPFFL